MTTNAERERNKQRAKMLSNRDTNRLLTELDHLPRLVQNALQEVTEMRRSEESPFIQHYPSEVRDGMVKLFGFLVSGAISTPNPTDSGKYLPETVGELADRFTVAQQMLDEHYTIQADNPQATAVLRETAQHAFVIIVIILKE